MARHPRPLAPSLGEACRRWADRPAVTHGGRTLTYAELWRQVEALSAAYAELGVGPGDRVLCQLPNSVEHVVAVAAAWTRRAMHVGTDDDLTASELAWLVRHLDARVLLTRPRSPADVPGVLAEVVEASPSTALFVDGGPDDLAYPSLAGVLAAGGDAPAVAGPGLAPDDDALVLLTSGTTGRPKGVVETMANGWAKMQFFADAYAPGPEDVHLLYLPMAHVFGLRLGLIALLTGGRLVLMERFSREPALRLVADEQVTVLPGMPAHFTLLLEALDPSRHRVDSLRWAVSAAANLPEVLARQLYDRLGVEILYVFGCSEGFTTRTTDRDEILAGSVGHEVYRGPDGTAPNGTVRVVDPDTRQPVPQGSVGEIAFGASRPVRYWGAGETATDGWYYTGDLGRIDADGRVYVLGRLKELVNRGGLKVAPTEVESVLRRHPAVADAAVVGVPDRVLGEAVCACIVPGATAVAPRLDEVREFLGTHLARHKLPDQLCVVDEVPRTKIGKVDRPALAAAVVAGDRRQHLR
jgi:acyl-CoA synthetase (AMP-forming)/AMP-acid ligase II